MPCEFLIGLCTKIDVWAEERFTVFLSSQTFPFNPSKGIPKELTTWAYPRKLTSTRATATTTKTTILNPLQSRSVETDLYTHCILDLSTVEGCVWSYALLNLGLYNEFNPCLSAFSLLNALRYISLARVFFYRFKVIPKGNHYSAVYIYIVLLCVYLCIYSHMFSLPLTQTTRPTSAGGPAGTVAGPWPATMTSWPSTTTRSPRLAMSELFLNIKFQKHNSVKIGMHFNTFKVWCRKYLCCLFSCLRRTPIRLQSSPDSWTLRGICLPMSCYIDEELDVNDDA